MLDAPYQASAALPRTAQRRQLADATAYSRVGAGEARLRVWARHVNHAGQQGPAATADVTPDPSGGMIWRGDWTTGTDYAVDDAVSNDGRSWICTTAHRASGSAGPTEDSHANWGLLAERGDDGVDGEGIDWRGAWDSGTRYAVDDAVSNDGRSWICTAAHRARGSTGPTEDSHANWDLLAERGDDGDDGDDSVQISQAALLETIPVDGSDHYRGLLSSTQVEWSKGGQRIERLTLSLYSRNSNGKAQARLRISSIDYRVADALSHLTELAVPAGPALSSSRRRRTTLNTSATHDTGYADGPRQWTLECAGVTLPIRVDVAPKPAAPAPVVTANPPTVALFVRQTGVTYSEEVTWTKTGLTGSASYRTVRFSVRLTTFTSTPIVRRANVRGSLGDLPTAGTQTGGGTVWTTPFTVEGVTVRVHVVVIDVSR